MKKELRSVYKFVGKTVKKVRMKELQINDLFYMEEGDDGELVTDDDGLFIFLVTDKPTAWLGTCGVQGCGVECNSY